MSDALDTAKLIWDVLKDGAKTDVSGTTVSVVPKGTTVADYTDWQGPTSYAEGLDKLGWFGEKLVDFVLSAQWQYNGTYIKDFNVIVDIDSLDPLWSVSVSITTMEGYYNADGIAELPYHMDVTVHGLVNGTQRTTFRAIACGDGGGRSTE